MDARPTCSRCGGPIQSNNQTGICSSNPECRKEKSRSWSREYHRALPREVIKAKNLYGAHGITPAEKRAMLDLQGGRCYLCRDPLAYDDAAVDHDHRCCDGATQSGGRRTISCATCRRGLACGPCNKLIGQVQDDAERLRRIADHLAAAVDTVTARLANADGIDSMLPLGRFLVP